MYTIYNIIYLTALLLLCDAIVTVENIRRCSNNLTVETKFYTVLDSEFDTKVKVIVRTRGPSGSVFITDENWDGKANIIENTLTLTKNGRIVNYDNNDCTHSKKEGVHFDCKEKVESEKTYYAGPVEKLTFSDGKKYIVFSKRNQQYAFELDQDMIRCGRKVWTTNYPNAITYENTNKEDCYEDIGLSQFSSQKLLSKLACA